MAGGRAGKAEAYERLGVASLVDAIPVRASGCYSPVEIRKHGMDCITLLSAIEGIDAEHAAGVVPGALPLAAVRIASPVGAYFGWQFARAGLAAPGCAPMAMLGHCLTQQFVTLAYMQRDRLAMLISGCFGPGEIVAALLDSMPYQQVFVCDHGDDAIRIGIEAARACLPADGMSQRVQYVHDAADALHLLEGRRLAAALLVGADQPLAQAVRAHAAEDGMMMLRAGYDRPVPLDGQQRAGERAYAWPGSDGRQHHLAIRCEEF